MVFVSSACLKQHNIAEIIRQLAERGIRNIELSGGTDYYDAIENDLKMLKQKHHLQYACHAYFPPPKIPFVVNLASCNDRIYQQSIDHYINCIEMLKRIGCKTLSIHAGFLIEIGADEVGQRLRSKVIYDEGKAYDRFCSAYKQITGLCIKNDIALYLENNVISAENYAEFGYHNYMMMTDYASIMKMKDQLEFNLLLDLGHLHVSSNTLGLDYAEECKKLSEYIKWLHISENNGIVDEHKPLKKDSEILKDFEKIYCRDKNITLETIGSIEELLSSIRLIEENEGC